MGPWIAQGCNGTEASLEKWTRWGKVQCQCQTVGLVIGRLMKVCGNRRGALESRPVESARARQRRKLEAAGVLLPTLLDNLGTAEPSPIRVALGRGKRGRPGEACTVMCKLIRC